MTTRSRRRDVVLVLVGVAGLLLKRPLAVFLGDVALSWAGNVSASFAVYFLVAIAGRARFPSAVVAGIALVVVQGFEFTNGYGVMTNVYDPFDYLANAFGIALAWLADLALGGQRARSGAGDSAGGSR